MTDLQRECIVAFAKHENDNPKFLLKKMCFVLGWLERKGLLEEFADHVGENLGFPVDVAVFGSPHATGV